MQQGKTLDDPGKYPFRINGGNILQIQVGGDQRRLTVQEPFIQTDKKLGGGERVAHLRTQVVNNQQVAVQDIPVAGVIGSGPAERTVR